MQLSRKGAELSLKISFATFFLKKLRIKLDSGRPSFQIHKCASSRFVYVKTILQYCSNLPNKW